MGACGGSDRVGAGASALAVDVLGDGIVCNHGTGVGDCLKRIPAMHVPDGDPEGAGHIGSLTACHSKKKHGTNRCQQGLVHHLMGCRDRSTPECAGARSCCMHNRGMGVRKG